MINFEYEKIISNAIAFVKEQLAGAESGHDWWHIQRVYTTVCSMAEKIESDRLIVELSALLHDIADAKFNGGDEEIGPAKVRAFLKTTELNDEKVEAVVYIVRNMSFKASYDFAGEKSIEFQIVQDADRLDAIGAIGIARAFSYGGYKGRPFYNPEILPEKYTNGKDYKSSISPTINHFYEKLLLLKELMNTDEGKRRAEKRHLYMVSYLQQFFDEWEGKS
ncbi:MAG: HD domain-containing protein [Bacteroidales bacterium]|nr:HD domain-containing protein [Bacteroidales bacterium]MDP2235802.1 HD domain-containing protein [Bacteroidales bacterium]